MGYFLYIIYSKRLNKFYVGHTDNLPKRLSQHNTGFSIFTSSSNDWHLVYSEKFETREGARKREIEIKKKKAENILNG